MFILFAKLLLDFAVSFVLDVVQNGIVSSCVHVIAVDLDAVNLDCELCSLQH